MAPTKYAPAQAPSLLIAPLTTDSSLGLQHGYTLLRRNKRRCNSKQSTRWKQNCNAARKFPLYSHQPVS